MAEDARRKTRRLEPAAADTRTAAAHGDRTQSPGVSTRQPTSTAGTRLTSTSPPPQPLQQWPPPSPSSSPDPDLDSTDAHSAPSSPPAARAGLAVPESISAEVFLARRLRHCAPASRPASSAAGPRSRIAAYAQQREAQDALAAEAVQLESALDGLWSGPLPVPTCELAAQAFSNLASFRQFLRDIPAALRAASRASQLDPSCSDIREQVLRLRRWEASIQDRAVSSRKAHERVSPAKALQPAVAVPRVDGRSMSAEQFARDFAQPRRPVVLTGLAHAMVDSADGLWTPELLTAVAGDCQVPLRRMACGSRNWAGLEAGATASVAEYVEHVCGRRPQTRLDGHYLFDWSLPLHCPALAARLTIPQTFAGNYLPHTADGTLFQKSWPSLFLAPDGALSELHIDTFGSHFWMALFTGKKHWTFFPREHTSFLYPEYEHSLDPSFQVDLDCPDFERFPLLAEAQPSECTLLPGDVLFVPAGCAHRVSANFVDASNFALARDELLAISAKYHGAEALVAQLERLHSERAK